MRAFVHEPMNARLIDDVLDVCPWLERHVLECALSCRIRRIGNITRHRHDHSRTRAPRHKRFELRSIDLHHAIEHSIVVTLERLPVTQRLFPSLTIRRKPATLEIRKRGLIRRDHPGARACFDAHVAKRHPPFHRKRTHCIAGVFDRVSGGSVSTDLADDSEREIFRRHSLRKRSARFDLHRPRLVLRQALRGQHVLDFTRPDAKCERAESTVSARVTITANDRHAWLRQAKLWSNDVNDALFGRVDVEELNSKLFAVSTECLDLIRGNRIGDRQAAIRSWNVVIDGAESEIRASHFAARLTQSVKRLRRRHLVNEMEIDVEERGLTTGFTNDVSLPELVE